MLNLRYAKDKTKYAVEFKTLSDHVVSLRGNLPIKTDGFYLSRENKEDNWDYSNYKTVYRKVSDGVQFSDDGSVYEPKLKDVTVSIAWSDADNSMGVRPASVDVEVKVNGQILEVVALSEANEWKKEYELMAEDDVAVDAGDIADYNKSIYGTQIAYSMDIPEPYEPTIDDLTEAIAEIYEMIDQNSNDILVTQEAVAEIYEMIGE